MKLRTDITSQQKKGQVGIQICDHKGDLFISMLHNELLAPDLCDGLFSIIKLMSSRHNFLYHKEFCTIYFSSKENNSVTLTHSAQRKHAFLGEIKEISKKKKLPTRRKLL